MARYDVIVIGAGVVGAAAAWRLAQRGQRTLLLEQFPLVHDRGASHGTSRIFRHAYANTHYVRLAAQAGRGWRELETLPDTELPVLTLTGAADHGDPVALRALGDALAANGIEYRELSPAEAQSRWPGLRFDTSVLFHADAGRLHADGAVRGLAAAARREGAEVRDNTAVKLVRLTARGAEVITDDDTLLSDQVVVAAGAWTPAVIAAVQWEDDAPRLPELRTTHEQPVHFPNLLPDADWPSFIHHPGAEWGEESHYGLASVDGVKLGEHGTGPVIDPDAPRGDGDPAIRERLIRYAAEWLPGVDVTAASPISCLYTTTPDSDFIIDRHERVTIAAGFSGHGFKFGPALGDLVADLVLGTGEAWPLFALSRFIPPASPDARAGAR